MPERSRGEAYKFYAEGVTPAVGRLYTAINAERVAVAAALGASVPNLEDWFERTYGVRGANLSETCQLLTTNSDGPYQATGTPSAWTHKYIAEDVPVGLMPMSALGKAAAVPTRSNPFTMSGSCEISPPEIDTPACLAPSARPIAMPSSTAASARSIAM